MSTPKTPEAPIEPFIPKWIMHLYMSLLTLGLIGLIAPAVGVPFLPSPEWLELSYIPSLISAGFLAFLGAWGLIFVAIKKKSLSTWLMLIVYVPFLMGLATFSGGAIVSSSVPLVLSAVLGSQTQHVRVVESASDRYSRRCSRRISLRDPSIFVTSALCGYQASFVRSLKPGDQLLLTGRGTEMGVLVSSVRKVR